MLVSALQGHQRWARHYDSHPNPLLSLETRVLGDLLPPIAGLRFLDVACGTGRWMTYLRQRGAHVFGVDVCAEMLAEAQRKPLARGRSVVGDATRLPFRSGAVDTVLCSFAVGYLADLQSAVAEMARVARPGARVIISDLHPERVSNGWTRSFRLGADVYEMEHFGPSLEQLRAAGQAGGLKLHTQIEACFGEPERPHFRGAGKEHVYFSLTGVSAVWVGIWTKS
jgi:ubiquinone/menaquinone biosynthesis C-methylase UbiE